MTLPARLRCPCGTLTPPGLKPRGGRKSMLLYFHCPACGLTTPPCRGAEQLTDAWNKTVERELARMREAGEQHR